MLKPINYFFFSATTIAHRPDASSYATPSFIVTSQIHRLCQFHPVQSTVRIHSHRRQNTDTSTHHPSSTLSTDTYTHHTSSSLSTLSPVTSTLRSPPIRAVTFGVTPDSTGVHRPNELANR